MKDFCLNEVEPHLKQTILPPKDLSETKSELPQFEQILMGFIFVFKFILISTNYINNWKCKEKPQIIL